MKLNLKSDHQGFLIGEPIEWRKKTDTLKNIDRNVSSILSLLSKRASPDRVSSRSVRPIGRKLNESISKKLTEVIKNSKNTKIHSHSISEQQKRGGNTDNPPSVVKVNIGRNQVDDSIDRLAKVISNSDLAGKSSSAAKKNEHQEKGKHKSKTETSLDSLAKHAANASKELSGISKLKTSTKKPKSRQSTGSVPIPTATTRNRDASGRFAPLSEEEKQARAAKAQQAKDRDARAIRTKRLLESIAQTKESITNAVANNADIDPTISAMKEVSEIASPLKSVVPLVRGIGSLFGQNKKEKKSRVLFKKILTTLKLTRRDETKWNRKQLRKLKEIENKKDSSSLGVLGSILMALMALPMLIGKIIGKIFLSGLAKLGLRSLLSAGGLLRGRRSRRGYRRGRRSGGYYSNRRTKTRTHHKNGRYKSKSGVDVSSSTSFLKKAGSKGAKLGSKLLKKIPIIGAILAAGSIYLTETSKLSRKEKNIVHGGTIGQAGGAIAGGFAGAEIGGTAGAFLGPLGVAIGGIIGGAAGAFFGSDAGQIIGEKVGEWTNALIAADIPGMIVSAWNNTISFISSKFDSISKSWDSMTAKANELWSKTKTYVKDSKIGKLAGKAKDKVDKAVSDFVKKPETQKVIKTIGRITGAAKRKLDDAKSYIKDKYEGSKAQKVIGGAKNKIKNGFSWVHDKVFGKDKVDKKHVSKSNLSSSVTKYSTQAEPKGKDVHVVSTDKQTEKHSDKTNVISKHEEASIVSPSTTSKFSNTKQEVTSNNNFWNRTKSFANESLIKTEALVSRLAKVGIDSIKDVAKKANDFIESKTNDNISPKRIVAKVIIGKDIAVNTIKNIAHHTFKKAKAWTNSAITSITKRKRKRVSPLSNTSPLAKPQKQRSVSRSVKKRWNAAKNDIVYAAKKAGVDAGILANIANFESRGFNPYARPISSNKSLNRVTQFDGVKAISSAHGYGQFLDETWTDMINKKGGKYGIKEAGTLKRYKDKNGRLRYTRAAKAIAAKYRNNTKIQAAMLAEFTKENIKLGKKYGGKDDNANVYAMHNLGSGDGAKFLKALKRDPNTVVSSVLSRNVIAGNGSLYGNGNITVGEAYKNMGRLMQKGDVFAKEARALQFQKNKPSYPKNKTKLQVTDKKIEYPSENRTYKSSFLTTGDDAVTVSSLNRSRFSSISMSNQGHEVKSFYNSSVVKPNITPPIEVNKPVTVQNNRSHSQASISINSNDADVGRDLSDRTIAHIVTGGFGGGVILP